MWKFQRSNKETHPSSQYKFAVRSSLIFFWRIIRAPLFWSLRSLWRLVLSALDQTISQYSMKGWTKVIYKSLQVSVSKYFWILPNKFNLRVTLLEMLLMCSCQSIEASKIKPKYFTVSDSSRSLPNKNKESPCDLARRGLEPKSITLVLSQFTSKRFKENHSPTAIRSSCRADWIVWMFLPAKNRPVSLAYKTILQRCTTLGISFINTINNNGPRTDPWGAPSDRSEVSE